MAAMAMEVEEEVSHQMEVGDEQEKCTEDCVEKIHVSEHVNDHSYCKVCICCIIEPYNTVFLVILCDLTIKYLLSLEGQ